jgi:hypothetical protein
MKKSVFLAISIIASLAAMLTTACGDKSPDQLPTTFPVTINEAYSRGGGDFDPGLDWVELHNPSSVAVDIGGFVLSDKLDLLEKITIPAGTTLPALGFLKVEVDTPDGFGLSSGGDVVYLYDAAGEQIDFVEFGAMEEHLSWSAVPDGSDTFKMQTPTPGASNNDIKVNPKISAVTHAPSSPSAGESVIVAAKVEPVEGTILSVVLRWTLAAAPQPEIAMTAGQTGEYSATIPAQAANTLVTYTIVARNSVGGEASTGGFYAVRTSGVVDYSGLKINEVDGNGKFVELFNSSAAAIPLNGVRLVKNEATAPADIWWTGGTLSIAPGDHYTICQEGGLPAEQVDETSGNGGISPKKNIRFDLLAPDDAAIDTFIRATTLGLDENCTPDYGKGTPYSFARCPDGVGAWGLAEPTPDAANPFMPAGVIVTVEAATRLTNLVINEIDGNGKFVEIRNNGDAAVSLAGVVLVKNLEFAPADIWWTGVEAASIAAGGHYTICQSGGELSGSVDEATGNGGISPKKTVRFDLISGGMSLDTFARVAADGRLDKNCDPDYGSGTQYSFARCPDGIGQWGLASPTVAAPNPATSAGEIETTLK